MKSVLRVSLLSMILFFMGQGAYWLKNQIKTKPYINVSKVKTTFDRLSQMGEKRIILVEGEDYVVDKERRNVDKRVDYPVVKNKSLLSG